MNRTEEATVEAIRHYARHCGHTGEVGDLSRAAYPANISPVLVQHLLRDRTSDAGRFPRCIRASSDSNPDPITSPALVSVALCAVPTDAVADRTQSPTDKAIARRPAISPDACVPALAEIARRNRSRIGSQGAPLLRPTREVIASRFDVGLYAHIRARHERCAGPAVGALQRVNQHEQFIGREHAGG